MRRNDGTIGRKCSMPCGMWFAGRPRRSPPHDPHRSGVCALPAAWTPRPGRSRLPRRTPVDQVGRLGRPARLGLDRHAVAQRRIHSLVVSVRAVVRVVGLAAELVQRHGDLRGIQAPLGEPVRQQLLLDVAVAGSVGPGAKEATAEFVAEQGDDAVLGCSLRMRRSGCFLAKSVPDVGHAVGVENRIGAN